LKITINKILNWAGSLLAIAGIVFVSIRLKEYSSQLDCSRLDVFLWSAMFGLSLVYCLINILLALAWQNILKYFNSDTTKLWAIKIYGLTQIAKYVPGNIMHLASRQAMGLSAGIGGWQLAKTSVWEHLILSVAGISYSIWIIPLFLPIVTTPITIVCFTAVVIIMMLVLNRYMSIEITRAFTLHTLFLTVSGMIFVSMLALLIKNEPITASQIFFFFGSFIIAWLAGLLTPGAPAGVGVREFILLLLLKGQIQETDLLLAVLLSRVITVTGDLLFFLLASLITIDKRRSDLTTKKE